MKYSKITAASEYITGKVDERIFGSFAEHLGRCIYGGLYEPGHPSADEDGLRTDVIELIKELNVPIIRYPGGNFVSGYNWEDGIGPVKDRPRRLELAWDSTETNGFGTDEFMRWCKKAGTSPMMAVNLGTRGSDAARNLVEYCNHPSGTYWSDLRRKNGAAEPYGVKLWCLGNEMDGEWQIGHKTAAEYAMLANDAAKLMKTTDRSIETVICGSSSWNMRTFGEWESTTLDIAYDNVDYISMHQYFGNNDHDLTNFLAKGVETDSFIESVISACDYVQGKKHSKKKINISFDEWNVWYHSNGTDFEKWSEAPHILEDVYNFADALVAGEMLNSILRHCDRVKIACLAQIVNVIAPIMTENGGRAWKQTIFYPFLYASKYARGYVLNTLTDTSKHDTKHYSSVPDTDTVMTLSEDGNTVALFAINRDTTDSILLEAKLLDFENFRPAEHIALENCAPDAVNTADKEEVKPVNKALPEYDGKNLRVKLSPMSWNLILLKKINN